MTYIPTDAERKQCCLNCRKFSECALVARWKVERGEDGFYPNALKCGGFKGNWLRVFLNSEAIVQGCPGVSRGTMEPYSVGEKE